MDALLHALSAWIDVEDAPRCELPRRVVVLGRTSVGKTSLVNALTGQQHPVGLGGVTREVRSTTVDQWTWIDTPGIDGRDRALNVLGPVVDTAHAVVWVTDGLQPLTRTERDVVDLLLPPGHPVDIVVGRADLLADDLEAVLARVRRLTAELAPRSITAANLRSLAPTVLASLRHITPTPSERGARRTWLEEQRVHLAAARPLDAISLASLVTLRPHVKTWLDERVAADLSVNAWSASFHDDLSALVDSAVIRWAADPRLAERIVDLPHLPPIPDPSKSALDGLRRSAAGRAATTRELRSLAGSWAAEAELRLVDWHDAQTFDIDALAAHQAADEALSAELRELGHQDDERR